MSQTRTRARGDARKVSPAPQYKSPDSKLSGTKNHVGRHSRSVSPAPRSPASTPTLEVTKTRSTENSGSLRATKPQEAPPDLKLPEAIIQVGQDAERVLPAPRFPLRAPKRARAFNYRRFIVPYNKAGANCRQTREPARGRSLAQPRDSQDRRPQILGQDEYEDEFVSVKSSLEFPFSVAQSIRDNRTKLQGMVMDLPGKYLFEGGYDIIPSLCQAKLPEQASYFQGKLKWRKMLTCKAFERCCG